MNPSLLDELLWETRSVDEGIRRYRRMQRQRPAEMPPAFKFLQGCMPALTTALAAEQARFRVRGPGRPAIRKDLVLSLPPEKLALITLSTVLTATCIRGRDATVTGIAGHIAEVCRLETEYQALRKTTPPWKRRTVIGWRNLPPREDRLVEWKFVGEKVNVGEELIQLLLDNVGGFRVEYRPAAPGRNPCARAAILALTRQAEEWLTTAHAEAEGLAPVSLPMIVVPEPWQGLAGGGYVTNRRTGALPLVKHLDDINIKELHAANLAGVYRAVNALQSTAWAINVDICALVRQAWNRRLDVGNLPLGTPESPRERPGEVPDRERRNLRLKWRRWYGKKGGVVSSATMLRMRLKYARLLKDRSKHSTFYLPYQLDTRSSLEKVDTST